MTLRVAPDTRPQGPAAGPALGYTVRHLETAKLCAQIDSRHIARAMLGEEFRDRGGVQLAAGQAECVGQFVRCGEQLVRE